LYFQGSGKLAMKNVHVVLVNKGSFLIVIKMNWE
jgi:hypothetical protein